MKKLLLATALCTLSLGASAARPWFGYNIAEQTCDQEPGTPAEYAKLYRGVFRTDVYFDDVFDSSGSVKATRLWWLDDHKNVIEAHMFRNKIDCEMYASGRRIDTDRYN